MWHYSLLDPFVSYEENEVLWACGLYYKHITIVNYDSSIVIKFGASLIVDARVIIYNHHMFIALTCGDYAIKPCQNVTNGRESKLVCLSMTIFTAKSIIFL